MLRLVSLAAILAVACSQTLLYPSSVARISLPQTQSSHVQYQSLDNQPVVYRYPATTYQLWQLVPVHQQQQFSQVYTNTQSLPIVWSRSGRSLGAVQPTTTVVAAKPSVPEPSVVRAAEPIRSLPDVSELRLNVVQTQPATDAGVQYVEPARPVISSSNVQLVAQAQPAPVDTRVRYVDQAQQTSGFVAPSQPAPEGSVRFVIAQQNAPETRARVEGGQTYVRPIVAQQVAPQTQTYSGVQIAEQPTQFVGILTTASAVGSNKLNGEPIIPIPVQSSHVSANQIVSAVAPANPAFTNGQIDWPSTTQEFVATPIQQSTSQQKTIFLPIQSVNQQVPTVRHQEPAGYHQVSQVILPSQSGAGSGYTSSAFYESAPAGGVVIAKPIVATNVKVNSKASPTVGEPVVAGHLQSTVNAVGSQQFEGKEKSKLQ